MYLTGVRFSCSDPTLWEDDELKDQIEWFLILMIKNGQICGEFQWCVQGGDLVAFVDVPRPNAHLPRFHSRLAKKEWKRLQSEFGLSVEWKILDDKFPNRFPRWQSSSFLYLFTHAFDHEPPVCRSDDGCPVPSYLLPIPDRTREELDMWAGNYKDHDRVWLHSGTLETAAYREMATPGSELSTIGRDLCSIIEEGTGKPTYYYLTRYWSRETGEEKRLCPSCGKPWASPGPRLPDRPFHDFDFRCEPCRLVSHIGDQVDHRRAHIGEYRSDTNKSIPSDSKS